MINLEIEIVAEDAREHVYELRNYLSAQMENLQIAVREQPALEGEMSVFSAEGILNGVIHAGMGIGIEHCIHLLWPLISDWIKKLRLPKGQKVEVLATLGDGNSRITLSEDNEGVIKRYDNVSYSIDTAHTRAILIGCGEFESDFSPILPVKSNLEDLYRLLTDKRNIGLLPENITVAINKTNAEIEELLLKTSRLPDTETLLIYFSGHGYRSDVNKLHLIARNTRKVEDYILNGIDYDFIRNGILKASPAKQKIVILDACHSGIATQGKEDAILEIQVTGSYVLASSESDEVSYFDKNKRNTFFTGILLDTLRKGIDNAREMLSLNDLYEAARAQLDQKQQPRFRDKLTISPADFFIARNPSFSLEKNIQHAERLFREGKLPEAYKEANKILKRFPDNARMKDVASRCNTELLVHQLVKEGDDFFYQRHNYRKALESYEQAHDIKPDFLLAEKIKSCKDQLLQEKPVTVIDTKSSADKHTGHLPAKEVIEEKGHEKKDKKEIPKQMFAIIIVIAIVAIASLLMIFFKEKKEKYTISELTGMLYTSPGEAFANLRKSKKKDSASYALGNYYRDDKKFDSAVYYYNKAIELSDLPAAYGALAEMYDHGQVKDSSDDRLMLTLLRRADSLLKADTTVYYLLGNKARGKAFLARISSAENVNELFNEAERWYLKSYKQGCRRCAEALAFLYVRRNDVPTTTFSFMKEAAENNSSEAQIYLSDMLSRGIGTPVDKGEAERWYRKFINNADPEGLASAADMYVTISGANMYPDEYTFDGNCKKAHELYQAAESKMDQISDATLKGMLYGRIASFYDSNTCPETKDHVKAVGYYRKADRYAGWISEMYLGSPVK